MMISIGDRHFIESEYIAEIIGASDRRADRMTRTATESGMLINATGGRRTGSIIRLKSKHIVLSARRVETLKSMFGKVIFPAASGKSDAPSRIHKNKHSGASKLPGLKNQRIAPDRRRFSYTHHIPERRSGYERRTKDRR